MTLVDTVVRHVDVWNELPFSIHHITVMVQEHGRGGLARGIGHGGVAAAQN